MWYYIYWDIIIVYLRRSKKMLVVLWERDEDDNSDRNNHRMLYRPALNIAFYIHGENGMFIWMAIFLLSIHKIQAKNLTSHLTILIKCTHSLFSTRVLKICLSVFCWPRCVGIPGIPHHCIRLCFLSCAISYTWLANHCVKMRHLI